MATLTYLANSGAFFVGGVALGYFLHDVRDAIKHREVKVVVVSKEDLEREEEQENGSQD